jgi:hypothetical protein
LFASELTVLEPVFATALALQRERPMTPISDEERRELAQLASGGKLSATVLTCRQPPSAERVALARYPTLSTAHLEVQCDDACEVRLVTRSTRPPFTQLGNGEATVEIARPVLDPERFASYADAVRGLATPSRTAPGPGTALGRALPPPSRARTRVTEVRVGPSFTDGFIDLPPNTRCLHGVDEVVLELGAGGDVTRCEVRTAWSPSCDLCPSLSSQPQPPGVEGRRAWLRVQTEREDRSSGNRSGTTVGDESRLRGRPLRPGWLTHRTRLAEDDRAALERINARVGGCVQTKRLATPADDPNETVTARLTVSREADGSVGRIVFDDVVRLKEDERACFERAIREVGFPCAVDAEVLVFELSGLRFRR